MTTEEREILIYTLLLKTNYSEECLRNFGDEELAKFYDEKMQIS